MAAEDGPFVFRLGDVDKLAALAAVKRPLDDYGFHFLRVFPIEPFAVR